MNCVPFCFVSIMPFYLCESYKFSSGNLAGLKDAVYFEVSSHHPYSALYAMCSTRLDAAEAIPYADDGAGGCNHSKKSSTNIHFRIFNRDGEISKRLAHLYTQKKKNRV